MLNQDYQQKNPCLDLFFNQNYFNKIEEDK